MIKKVLSNTTHPGLDNPGFIARAGDVFGITTPKGVAIVQLIETPVKTDFPVIRVLPGLNDSLPIELESNVKQKELFFLRYPIHVEAKRRTDEYVKYVGNYEIPKQIKWPDFMRAHVTNHLTGIGHWDIIRRATWGRRGVFKLSDEEKKLSPFEVPSR